MKVDLRSYEVWLATGSQHLYGEEILLSVADNARRIAEALDGSRGMPVRVVFKPVLTTSDSITRFCRAANGEDRCIGVVAWMHTFSPAKMWIAGLSELTKPLAHLHTQFTREIPWASIDMDFMNLNQSAHGDREFGYICSRLRKARKVIVGYWQDPEIQADLAGWMRAASARHEMQVMRVARFGDNMRDVAVTEGDKVEAQAVLGFSVNGYGLGELAARAAEVTDALVDAAIREYEQRYRISASLRRGGDQHGALRDAARIESALRSFLSEGGFGAFTTTFEDLHGLTQLPGLAVQRLMEDGWGFGAEGDWKTAALVRAMKVLSAGLPGGSTFMEDYTYHLDPGQSAVLGAHMLEVCPSIAADQPSLEIHPLSIGGKSDPPRLVFGVSPGRALNASLIDLGDRFRIIANEVVVTTPPEPLPRLPVARVLWAPRPNLRTAASAWISAGGAHHTVFSQAVAIQHLDDLADMLGIELLVIDDSTDLRDFRNELRWNDTAFRR